MKLSMSRVRVVLVALLVAAVLLAFLALGVGWLVGAVVVAVDGGKWWRVVYATVLGCAFVGGAIGGALKVRDGYLGRSSD